MVKAEKSDTPPKKAKSVAVMSDFYNMDDLVSADALAAEVRSFLKKQGYVIKSSEVDADMVVVPTLAQSQGSESSLSASTTQRVFSEVSRPNMMLPQSEAARLGAGGGFSAPPSYEVELPKTGLMLTAFARESWLKPVPVEGDIPHAWRIMSIMETPRNQETPVTLLLLQAMEPAMKEIKEGSSPAVGASRP